MTVSTINRFINLFAEAFGQLSVKVPMPAVEQLAMVVHNAMDQGRRTYHTSGHVFEVCDGLNPRQTLAALFHDTVYYHVDGGFPRRAEPVLMPLVQVGALAQNVPVARRVTPKWVSMHQCDAVG